MLRTLGRWTKPVLCAEFWCVETDHCKLIYWYIRTSYGWNAKHVPKVQSLSEFQKKVKNEIDVFSENNTWILVWFLNF